MLRRPWRRILWIAPVAGLAADLPAVEIYKCDNGRGGQVFSDKPCGDRAQRIELKDKDSPAHATHSGSALRLVYAGQPLRSIVAAAPTFSISNMNRERPKYSVRYNVSEDSYSFSGLDEGEYSINIEVDANTSNPGNFPGDYRGHARFTNIKGRSHIIPVHMERLIHLLKPQDNQLPLVPWGSGCEQVISVVPGTVLEWESLGSGVSYTLDIRRTECKPFGWKESSLSRRVTETRIPLDLQPNRPNEMYTLTMKAHDTSGTPVGTLMTHGLNGYGWDYRFRIGKPESKKPSSAAGP